MVLRTAWAPSLALALAGALALASRSCASDPSRGVSSTSVQSAMVTRCPLGVPDTRILVDDTADGADVLLTTTSSYVPELRRRADHQAELQRPDAGSGAAHANQGDAAHGLRLWDMPVGRVISYERDRGARIHVVASDVTHVTELQSRLHRRAAELDDPACR